MFFFFDIILQPTFRRKKILWRYEVFKKDKPFKACPPFLYVYILFLNMVNIFFLYISMLQMYTQTAATTKGKCMGTRKSLKFTPGSTPNFLKPIQMNSIKKIQKFSLEKWSPISFKIKAFLYGVTKGNTFRFLISNRHTDTIPKN